MNAGVDLHIHTDASDSSQTITEMFQEARLNNVRILSITDHNTVAAYRQLPDLNDVVIIPGIEFTAEYDEKIQLHILGYGIDVNNFTLNKQLQMLQYSYLRALQRMMLRINKEFGINIQEELKARSLNMKRKNICKIIMETTSLKNKVVIYNKYLNYQNKGCGFKYLSVQEVIQIIVDAGGIPVLAHPYKLDMSTENIEQVLIRLKRIGLQGIEVYHPSQIDLINYFENLAVRYSFLISGGSDMHGKYTPERKIGYFGNKRLRPRELTLLERINWRNENK